MAMDRDRYRCDGCAGVLAIDPQSSCDHQRQNSSLRNALFHIAPNNPVCPHRADTRLEILVFATTRLLFHSESLPCKKSRRIFLLSLLATVMLPLGILERYECAAKSPMKKYLAQPHNHYAHPTGSCCVFLRTIASTPAEKDAAPIPVLAECQGSPWQ